VQQEAERCTIASGQCTKQKQEAEQRSPKVGFWFHSYRTFSYLNNAKHSGLLGIKLVMIVYQNDMQIFQLFMFSQEARKLCLVRWVSNGFGLLHRRKTAKQQITLSFLNLLMKRVNCSLA